MLQSSCFLEISGVITCRRPCHPKQIHISSYSSNVVHKENIHKLHSYRTISQASHIRAAGACLHSLVKLRGGFMLRASAVLKIQVRRLI